LKLAAVSQKTASSQASSVENQLRGEIDILKKQNDSQIAKLESQTDDLKKQVASLMQDNAKLKQSQTHSIQGTLSSFNNIPTIISEMFVGVCSENNQQLTKLETEWKEKVATATARLTSQLKVRLHTAPSVV
jgi:regulator of replication initiation timing